MKSSWLILIGLLLFSACYKETVAPQTTNLNNNDELLGYWKFVRHEPHNGRVYARVPNDDGLDEIQKNMMLRFLPPDQFGEFFWNWCGTPPALPSDWRNGTWQRRANTPEVLDVTLDGFPLVITIMELQPDSLFVRHGF